MDGEREEGTPVADAEPAGSEDAEVSAPVETTESADEELTLAEAFEQAKAELAAPDTESSTDAGSTEGEGGEPSGEPEGEAASEPEEGESGSQASEERTEPQTSQGAIDRILTLIKQGRIAELSPAEKGTVNALRQQIEHEQRQEEQFRELYLELELLKENDPAEFAKRVDEDPRLVTFRQLYKRAHPDITLDNPQPKQKPEHVIRDEVNSEWETHVMEAAKGIAKDAGVPEQKYAELAEKHGNALGTLLASAVTEAVNTRVEKELSAQLEKAVAEERAAIRAELESEFANKTMVSIKAGGLPEDPNGTPRSTGNDLLDALNESKKELGIPG